MKKRFLVLLTILSRSDSDISASDPMYTCLLCTQDGIRCVVQTLARTTTQIRIRRLYSYIISAAVEIEILEVLDIPDRVYRL